MTPVFTVCDKISDSFDARRAYQSNIQIIIFQSFLIMPMQRICRMPLLLSAVLKQTEEDNPDRWGSSAKLLLTLLLRKVIIITNTRELFN